MRSKQKGAWIDDDCARRLGLDPSILSGAVEYTYRVLDSLDDTLVAAGEPRLAGLLELANLSAIIGNLFRGGLAGASGGRFEANGPHKYPDLLSRDSRFESVEIKVALEDNKPKGHLIKPGPHVVVRYALGDENGGCAPGKENRGSVVWIWEVRAGVLQDDHFNVSNTPGDSGKTAVINKDGMEALKIVFVDLDRSPYTPTSRTRRSLSKLLAD